MKRPWWLRNWADTAEDGDGGLGPLELAASLPEAVSRLEVALARLPHWKIEKIDMAHGSLTLTRRTAWWGFVDDVTLRLEPTATGTRVHGRSASRVGLLDFGQNRRNLRELFAAVRAI